MNERASVAPARVTTLPERPFLPSASTKKPLIAWSTTASLSKSTQEIDTSWISTLPLARLPVALPLTKKPARLALPHLGIPAGDSTFPIIGPGSSAQRHERQQRVTP